MTAPDIMTAPDALIPQDALIPTRRDFLVLAAASPLGLLTPAVSRAADAPTCYDPATLPFSQKSLRRSVGYVEASPDPKKHCGACAFFTAAPQSGCGTCQLLSGGAVNAGSVCNSFAPKVQR